jgi:hypothetical protein
MGLLCCSEGLNTVVVVVLKVVMTRSVGLLLFEPAHGELLKPAIS